MSSQTRRSVSVRGLTYARLRVHCDGLGESISTYIERLIDFDLGGVIARDSAKAKKVAAQAKALKEARKHIAKAAPKPKPIPVLDLDVEGKPPSKPVAPRKPWSGYGRPGQPFVTPRFNPRIPAPLDGVDGAPTREPVKAKVAIAARPDPDDYRAMKF